METRNYDSGAIATPPDEPVSPSNGYPTDGDPQSGVSATIPGAHWFYKVGESLRSIITDSGLIPDDADLTLLLQAVKLLAIPIKSSLYAANGYVVLDGGDGNPDFIIQWGTVAGVAGGATSTVTLPLAFPNQAFGALATNPLGGTVETIEASATQTQVQMKSTSPGTWGSFWLVIGN